MSETFEPDTGEMIVKRVSVPIGLEELMEGLAKEVLLKKPDDIYIFAAEYFSRLLLLREKGSYKVKTVRNVQSVAKQTSKRPIEKLLVRGAPKQLSRQISIRGDSPVKVVAPVRRPPARMSRDDKGTERRKYVDRSKLNRTEIIKPNQKHNASVPKPRPDNSAEKSNTINSRDKSLKISRRGRSTTRNGQDTPRQKSISTPRKAEIGGNEDDNKTSAKSGDKNKFENTRDKPKVPQVSSIAEAHQFVEVGKLAVTPPKTDKQSPASSSILPQTIGHSTSDSSDTNTINSGEYIDAVKDDSKIGEADLQVNKLHSVDTDKTKEHSMVNQQKVQSHIEGIIEDDFGNEKFGEGKSIFDNENHKNITTSNIESYEFEEGENNMNERSQTEKQSERKINPKYDSEEQDKISTYTEHSKFNITNNGQNEEVKIPSPKNIKEGELVEIREHGLANINIDKYDNVNTINLESMKDKVKYEKIPSNLDSTDNSNNADFIHVINTKENDKQENTANKSNKSNTDLKETSLKDFKSEDKSENGNATDFGKSKEKEVIELTSNTNESLKNENESPTALNHIDSRDREEIKANNLQKESKQPKEPYKKENNVDGDAMKKSDIASNNIKTQSNKIEGDPSKVGASNKEFKESRPDDDIISENIKDNDELTKKILVIPTEVSQIPEKRSVSELRNGKDSVNGIVDEKRQVVGNIQLKENESTPNTEIHGVIENKEHKKGTESIKIKPTDTAAIAINNYEIPSAIELENNQAKEMHLQLKVGTNPNFEINGDPANVEFKEHTSKSEKDLYEKKTGPGKISDNLDATKDSVRKKSTESSINEFQQNEENFIPKKDSGALPSAANFQNLIEKKEVSNQNSEHALLSINAEETLSQKVEQKNTNIFNKSDTTETEQNNDKTKSEIDKINSKILNKGNITDTEKKYGKTNPETDMYKANDNVGMAPDKLINIEKREIENLETWRDPKLENHEKIETVTNSNFSEDGGISEKNVLHYENGLKEVSDVQVKSDSSENDSFIDSTCSSNNKDITLYSSDTTDKEPTDTSISEINQTSKDEANVSSQKIENDESKLYLHENTQADIIKSIIQVENGLVDHRIKSYIGDFILNEQKHVFHGKSETAPLIEERSLQGNQSGAAVVDKQIEKISNQEKNIEKGDIAAEIQAHKINFEDTESGIKKQYDEIISSNDSIKPNDPTDLRGQDDIRHAINSVMSIEQTGQVNDVARKHINAFLLNEKSNVYTSEGKNNDILNLEKEVRSNKEHVNIPIKDPNLYRKTGLEESATHTKNGIKSAPQKIIKNKQLSSEPHKEVKQIRRIKTVDVLGDANKLKTQLKSRIPTADFRTRITRDASSKTLAGVKRSNSENDNAKWLVDNKAVTFNLSNPNTKNETVKKDTVDHTVKVEKPKLITSSVPGNDLVKDVLQNKEQIGKLLEEKFILKEILAAIKIQSLWRGFMVRNKRSVMKHSPTYDKIETGHFNLEGVPVDDKSIGAKKQITESHSTDHRHGEDRPNNGGEDKLESGGSIKQSKSVEHVAKAEGKNINKIINIKDMEKSAANDSNAHISIENLVKAAMTIQKIWRAYKVRKDKTNLDLEKKLSAEIENNNLEYSSSKQTDASEIFQSEATEKRFKTAAITIQKYWRGFKIRRILKRDSGHKIEQSRDTENKNNPRSKTMEEEIIKGKANDLESKKSMESKHTTYSSDFNKAAIIIQKIWRGFKVRNILKMQSSLFNQVEPNKTEIKNEDIIEKQELHKIVESKQQNKTKIENDHAELVKKECPIGLNEKLIKQPQNKDEAAIMIQKNWRGFQTRNLLNNSKPPTEKNISNMGNEHEHEDIIEKEEFHEVVESKKQNITEIENDRTKLVKNECLTGLNEKLIKQPQNEDEAAIMIQKNWRGFQTRNLLNNSKPPTETKISNMGNIYKQENIIEKEELHKVIVSKQPYKTEIENDSAKLVKNECSTGLNKKLIKQPQNEDEAAIMIQKNWRGFQTRNLLNNSKPPTVTKISNMGYESEHEDIIQKKELHNVVESKKQENENEFIKAAILLQKVWRGFNIRKALGKSLDEPISMKNRSISKTALEIQRLGPEEKLVKAATMIQKIWRGFKVRKVTQEKKLFGKSIENETPVTETVKDVNPTDKKSALKIQSLWRGYQVRKNINVIKNKLETVGSKKGADKGKELTDGDILNAATKIQAGIRRNLERKTHKDVDLKLNSISEEDVNSGGIKPNETFSKQYSSTLDEEDISDEQVLKALQDLEAIKVPNEIPVLHDIDKPKFYRSNTVQEPEIISEHSSLLFKRNSEDTNALSHLTNSTDADNNNNNSTNECKKFTPLEIEVKKVIDKVVSKDQSNLNDEKNQLTQGIVSFDISTLKANNNSGTDSKYVSTKDDVEASSIDKKLTNITVQRNFKNELDLCDTDSQNICQDSSDKDIFICNSSPSKENAEDKCTYERPLSLDSNDSAETVIYKDISDKNNPSRSKEIHKSQADKTLVTVNTESLSEHETLINDIQNKLLDQISGNNGSVLDTVNKFDIEQLRKELEQVGVIYNSQNNVPIRHENSREINDEHDQLLDYLQGFELSDQGLIKDDDLKSHLLKADLSDIKGGREITPAETKYKTENSNLDIENIKSRLKECEDIAREINTEFQTDNSRNNGCDKLLTGDKNSSELIDIGTNSNSQLKNLFCGTIYGQQKENAVNNVEILEPMDPGTLKSSEIIDIGTNTNSQPDKLSCEPADEQPKENKNSVNNIEIIKSLNKEEGIIETKGTPKSAELIGNETNTNMQPEKLLCGIVDEDQIEIKNDAKNAEKLKPLDKEEELLETKGTSKSSEMKGIGTNKNSQPDKLSYESVEEQPKENKNSVNNIEIINSLTKEEGIIETKGTPKSSVLIGIETNANKQPEKLLCGIVDEHQIKIKNDANNVDILKPVDTEEELLKTKGTSQPDKLSCESVDEQPKENKNSVNNIEIIKSSNKEDGIIEIKGTRKSSELIGIEPNTNRQPIKSLCGIVDEHQIETKNDNNNVEIIKPLYVEEELLETEGTSKSSEIIGIGTKTKNNQPDKLSCETADEQSNENKNSVNNIEIIKSSNKEEGIKEIEGTPKSSELIGIETNTNRQPDKSLCGTTDEEQIEIKNNVNNVDILKQLDTNEGLLETESTSKSSEIIDTGIDTNIQPDKLFCAKTAEPPNENKKTVNNTEVIKPLKSEAEIIEAKGRPKSSELTGIETNTNTQPDKSLCGITDVQQIEIKNNVNNVEILEPLDTEEELLETKGTSRSSEILDTGLNTNSQTDKLFCGTSDELSTKNKNTINNIETIKPLKIQGGIIETNATPKSSEVIGIGTNTNNKLFYCETADEKPKENKNISNTFELLKPSNTEKRLLEIEGTLKSSELTVVEKNANSESDQLIYGTKEAQLKRDTSIPDNVETVKTVNAEKDLSETKDTSKSSKILDIGTNSNSTPDKLHCGTTKENQQVNKHINTHNAELLNTVNTNGTLMENEEFSKHNPDKDIESISLNGLLHTGEFHDSVLPLSKCRSSENLRHPENTTTEPSSQNASENFESLLLHTGELHDMIVVPLLSPDSNTNIKTQEPNIKRDTNVNKLLHTGELHDTILVPISSQTTASFTENHHKLASTYNDLTTPIHLKSSPKEDLNQPTGLLHTGELHDSIVIPSSESISKENPEHGENSKTDPVEHGPRQVDSECQTNGNPPIAVQLNEVPAGDEVLTSPRPAPVVPDVIGAASHSAQAPDKGALPNASTSYFSPPSDLQAMESEKRTNTTENNKSMEAEAATKIQAGFRGYQVRKQLKLKNGSSDINNQKRQLRRKSSGRLTETGRIAQNKPKDPNEIEEKSAVKIQAGVRGFLVRRRQKKQKNQES